MSEQAFQALTYLAEHGPCRLGTDPSIIEKMSRKGLIERRDVLSKDFYITAYGKGVLREIKRAGTEAMIKRMEAYL